MARHVNLTPRWTEILPTWLMLFEQAVTGNCMNPDLIKDNAKQEFRRMAEAADRYHDLLAGLRKQDAGYNDDEAIKRLLTLGRKVQEAERNTVKES